MELTKILGQALLWIGFIVAAFFSVQNIEPEGVANWGTINWIGYIVAIFVGGFGVVLLRGSAKAAAEESGRVEAEFSTLTKSLDALASGLGELQRRLATMQPKEVVQFIDDELAPPFSDFADARNALVQRFGLQGFADVMTQFASAERFVNRAWSAAADGYMGEAHRSLEQADGFLHQAHALMNELTK